MVALLVKNGAPVPIELPTDVHNLLVDSYNNWKDRGTDRSRDVFFSRLRAVHEAGWSQSSISRTLDLSRERVRQMLVLVDERDGEIPKYRTKIEAPPPREPSRKSPGYPPVPPELIDEYAKRLLAIQPLATMARGHHAPDSPERKASDEYSRILKEAADNNVPITVLADKVGRHVAGLRTRIRTADRIGTLGTSGKRHKNGVRDPKVVERWAKKLRPLLDDIAGGGLNVDRTKAIKAREVLRDALDPPNNVSLQALADACDRSYHSLWVRYTTEMSETRKRGTTSIGV